MTQNGWESDQQLINWENRSVKIEYLPTHLIVYKNIPNDDGTHTEFHLSLNYDFPKMGLLIRRIILCASVDSFSTISLLNNLFKIYRGTLVTEDIFDDGDDRRN